MRNLKLTTTTGMATAQPVVPIAPLLSLAAIGRSGAGMPCVLDAGPACLVTSGRIAIGLALREMGVGQGDAVLLPAYHSMSMVSPVLWRGAAPVFYKVGADAAVDLDDLAARLGPTVKAIIVTHYFGFHQDMAPIRALCDAHGVHLLEDCAHCFFGEHAGRPVGTFGDYAIASSMKFFPVYEGGVLVSARHRLAGVSLRSAGAGFEAKVALTTLEKSFAYRRLSALHMALWLPLKAKDLVWRALKARRPAAADAVPLAPTSSDSSYQFDPYWIDKRSSIFSRLMLRIVARPRIVALRRAHYLRLQQAVTKLPGCRPLFARLPDGVCPWQFPLLVDDPEPLFQRLRDAGVPVVRFAETLWPGVDAATCADSVYLSRHVLAFPCHQELAPGEVDWMIARLQQASLA
jgi:dTDP-4-amino-4,6-dideoxygalactose transaminase